MLAARGAVQIDLDERAFAADNEATVRAFWKQAAPELALDAKFVAKAVAGAAGNAAVRVLGGYGYCTEYRVEQFLRDTKLIEIGGGTIEAHQKNITRDLTRP